VCRWVFFNLFLKRKMQIRGNPLLWTRYLWSKLQFSASQTIKNLDLGVIKEQEVYNHLLQNFRARLTFKSFLKGMEMVPTFSNQGETLLIRSLPRACPRYVFVGDVVMLKDPQNEKQELVRRVAAIEGEEMVSSKDEDEPFQLDPGMCWVLCDNESINAKDAQDSRSFGPLPLQNIIGRAIYSSRSAVEHGVVMNSELAMRDDYPVLVAELDVEELTGKST